uniref:Uncharacterized protein n=1 Tax=Anguilla anguilla TaxID=7936 RepID=A0A0E9PRM7_ANGAN
MGIRALLCQSALSVLNRKYIKYSRKTFPWNRGNAMSNTSDQEWRNSHDL